MTRQCIPSVPTSPERHDATSAMQLHKAESDAYDYRWVVEMREHKDQLAQVYVATRNDAASAVASLHGSTQASASQVENGRPRNKFE